MDNDIISRQAAIDALDEYIEEYSYDLDNDGYHNPKWCAMQEARMTIQRLPSAERWIPVTEKLPEKDGNYLVTYTDGGVTEVGSSMYIQRVDGSEPYWDYFSVIAWRPLPTPYKGGESNC